MKLAVRMIWKLGCVRLTERPPVAVVPIQVVPAIVNLTRKVGQMKDFTMRLVFNRAPNEPELRTPMQRTKCNNSASIVMWYANNQVYCRQIFHKLSALCTIWFTTASNYLWQLARVKRHDIECVKNCLFCSLSYFCSQMRTKQRNYTFISNDLSNLISCESIRSYWVRKFIMWRGRLLLNDDARALMSL
jgi:hypothetical protein